MKILVSGSLAYDRIMNFPDKFSAHILPEKIHVLSISFLVKNLQENFGGTAGNISYNLALLGLRPVILGSVGGDFKRYRQWLHRFRIDLRGVKVLPKENTATCHIITDQSNCQIAGFYPGAMARSNWQEVVKTKWLKDIFLAIISPGNFENMIKLPSILHGHRIPYIFDPGQMIPAFTKSQLFAIIKRAKALVVNDYELALVLKKMGISKKKLLSLVELLVITFGEKGSIIESAAGQVIKIPPAKPLNSSDPTGAGDAYRAGLIKGLVEKWPLEKIGRLASVVSVYTVEKYGTQTHHFSWRSLARRYRDNFQEKL